ncbi:hypothetical protein P5G51_007755 [Virgibacillus sp. 179-BFC.A HS]|uniref:Uncharacterized protein n=1 Tax=Tigheibacillus jepli TaxID=3035914 RepID=A0ABU5CG59_9BACI|nr:hypothetical protein [Virgibacillus sp. 179-BFC.A HS]MDY0405306.1 hypothetical protein [Virgibacillus sp. 179-BFC.A HS]
MWDKWKKKIENFIWKEVEVDVEAGPEETKPTGKEDTYRLGNQHETLKAKIAYQYPKSHSHSLPPIQHKHGTMNAPKPTDKPAYQRRKEKASQQKSGLARDEFHGQPKESRKVYKKDPAKPFKPSSVPSPIYGYHERQHTNKIDKVPSFMRT